MHAPGENRWQSGRGRLLVPLALALMVLVLCTGCEPEVAETGAGYLVRRVDPEVFATHDNTQPDLLLRLTNDDPHDLVGRRMVATEDNGQALIWSSVCKGLYLYGDSKLTLSETPEGGGTGADAVGAGTSNDCDISIRTMPADISKSGTWFSFSYVEDLELVLVIVGEGTVAVTPVTRLDYKLVDPELLAYEVTTRELGDAQEVTVRQGDPPRFLYTAPDDRIADLRKLGDLPAERSWLGLEELPAVRLVVHKLEPQLELWLGDIWEQAGLDSIPVPELPPLDQLGQPSSAGALAAVVAGELWYDDRVLDAITLAVEWDALLEKEFGTDRPLELTRWEASGEEVSVRPELRAAGFDPEAAQELMAEAGFPGGFKLTLITSADEAHRSAAGRMAEELAAIGVKAEVVEVPPGEELAWMSEAVRGGQQVLWLRAP
jgi:hypothetical protein